MSRITLRIQGGRILCPASGVDAPGTVDIAGETVAAVHLGVVPLLEGVPVLDAQGLVVAPGFVDLHAELGEPGFERRETLDHALAAAAQGGFTAVCASPASDPANDCAAITGFLVRRAAEVGGARLLPIAALTLGREGKRLSEMFTLREAGAVAFGDGDRAVVDSGLLRRGMEYAHAVGVPVFEFPEDRRLSGRGTMHEGPVATRLGLKGVPAAAEDVMVWRAVALAEQTGARIHLGPLSTAGAVRAVRLAKAQGLPVTAAVSATHLHLTDEAVAESGYSTHLRLRPPVRGEADRAALRAGLADGTLDAVTSHHSPQTFEDKALEFDLAAPGAIGLGTALGLTLRWAEIEGRPLADVVRALATGPAGVLGRGASIQAGDVADLVVFDPDARTRIEGGQLASKARNTPWLGHALPGRVQWTVVGGRVVHRATA
ncbi:MAG: dihydroorotase [Myxococcales bacterium]|nr:dihydroorotase [Myxococcales bacterium]